MKRSHDACPKNRQLSQAIIDEYCFEGFEHTRSRSRSPLSLSSITEDDSKTEQKPNRLRFRKPKEEPCEKILILSNVPSKWDWEECRQFLLQHVSSDLKTRLPFVEKLKNTNNFKLKFPGVHECNEFFKEIVGLTAEGKKIHVKRYVKDHTQPQKKIQRLNPLRKVIQIEDSTCQNPIETYGLSLDFLNNLNVSLPLKRHIFISNLPIIETEEKLKEIFSLAGEIVNLSIFKTTQKCFGKITYDHPVEAVQAISMFNGQKLYDRSIGVQFDLKSRPQLLPEGLEGVGPGLGTNGEPLRGIRHIALMEPLKQYITQEIERLKNLPDNGLAMNTNMMGAAMQSLMTPLNIATMNTVPGASMYGIVPQASGWQGLLQQNNGTAAPQTLTMFPPQTIVNNMSGAKSTQMVTDQRPTTSKMCPDKVQDFVSDLLVFKNLPPSVTGHALQTKMSEVGPVIFTEMTGEGRAIVRFSDTNDAQRCIDIFHHTKVDGQLIEVKFF